MIKLYQFPTAWGLPNPSPFCMKLEVYMRLAEIPPTRPGGLSALETRLRHGPAKRGS